MKSHIIPPDNTKSHITPPDNTSSQQNDELVTKVEAALERIGGGPQLNTFITLDAEGARRQAAELDATGDDLPLRGMTITVKDNVAVAGMPMTGGTPALRGYTPDADAVAVRLLREAGVIILGKANMHELAYGITSNNAAFGAVGNAHNPAYIAGGSSGGTGAAIAAGYVDAGLGSDTGGSSRIPAALNGTVGFRPTVGRYSSDGVLRISSTKDTIGPMARTVEDVARLDAVMANESHQSVEPAGLSGLRLGVPRAYFYDNLDLPVEVATNALLSALRAAGVELVEADLVNVPELSDAVAFPLVMYETPRLISEWLAANKTGVSFEGLVDNIASPDVQGVITKTIDEPVPEEAYRAALDRDHPALKKAYADYFSENDVEAVIYPTTPLVARPIATSDETVTINAIEVPTFPAYIRNTDPGSSAGIPSLSIPSGHSEDGLPVGAELDGPEGSDRRLLSIGLAIERLIRSR